MSRNAAILTAGFNASAHAPTEWIQQTWKPAIVDAFGDAVEVFCFNHDAPQMFLQLRDLLLERYTVCQVGHSWGGAATIDASWAVVNPQWPHYKRLPFGAIIAHSTLLDPVENPGRGQILVMDLSPIVLTGKAWVCASPIAHGLRPREGTVRENQIVNLTHSGVTQDPDILAASIEAMRKAFNLPKQGV